MFVGDWLGNKSGFNSSLLLVVKLLVPVELIPAVQILLEDAFLLFNLSAASHWTVPNEPFEFNLYFLNKY